MTNIDWEPIGMHYDLMKIAEKYGISRKEVKITMLRVMLRKLGLMKCDHPHEHLSIRPETGKARSQIGKLHCKWCWTWIESPPGKKGFIDGMGRWVEGETIRRKPIQSKLEKDLEDMVQITLGDGWK